jgi:HEAT repeat protein
MTDRDSKTLTKNPHHYLGAETKGEPCSPEEMEAIRSCMAMFEKATKSYSLYPKDHAILENLLRRFENSLANFFLISPILKLNIEKESILFKGIEIYRSKEKEDYLVTPFFRDGIIWIEFNDGVQNTELSSLLQSLNECRILNSESEDDLVTALWKQNLPNIHYEATEVYWKTEPKLDFSQYNVAGAPNHKIQDPVSSGGQGRQAGAEDIGGQAEIGFASPEDMQDLTQITSEEKEKIQKMILEDEKRNHTEDSLDVFLILLEDENESKTFSNILTILTQEFETILKKGEFQLAFKLLNYLKKLSGAQPELKPWQGSLIDKFFEAVSDPKLLLGLNVQVPKLKPEDTAQLKTLRQVLTMLRPKVVFTLGPLLSKVSSSEVRRILMECIVAFSKQDIGPLTELLKHPDEMITQQLVIVLGCLNNEQSHKKLLSMVRHPASRVRRESLEQLLKNNGKVKQSFFFLIEDPNDIIRIEILNRLGAERHRESERLLLKYLSEKAYNLSSRNHIISCYKALGRCGSLMSVAYLKAALHERPWVDVFTLDQSLHRLGAAMALAELGMPETDEILQQAAKSYFPQIKRAARSVFLKKERHER